LSRAFRVLVLGGYGHFGGRICRTLAAEPDIALIIAGRRLEAARAFVQTLRPVARERCECAELDYASSQFACTLAALKPDLVIHTSGPFQGAGYTVAHAAINARAHYIDLADAREFVAGIGALDTAARGAGVLVVSGASTLPALSAAVVEANLHEFQRLEAVEISIAPGQRTPRGVATIAAVLSYCGKPFKVLQDGQWRTAYGWMDLHHHCYPRFGCRWLARCDVPDLELFPKRYPTLNTMRFDAALEIGLLQFGFWVLAALTRWGIVHEWSAYARLLLRMGSWFDWMGSEVGGMHVEMRGIGDDGRPKTVVWNLVARRGHGPEIPCIAAIVLARKLASEFARGIAGPRGAMPCMGLMTLEEFGAAVAHLDIAWETHAVMAP
jgi:NAD(P)-dependent dehydrogenase (short-subunit alcohol dehydrogenase family)